MQNEALSKPPGGATKLPTLSKNSKIHKRPISRSRVINRGGTPLSPKQPIIYIGTRSPFMGIVSKVRHALDRTGPARSTKGLPLATRMAALSSPAAAPSSCPEDSEVLVRGTGRAMAKALHLAAWFGRQGGHAVSVRTMSLETVDDVVVDEGDGADEEGGFAAEGAPRARMVNCLEVGISHR